MNNINDLQMKYCGQCGQQIPATATTCTHCGVSVTSPLSPSGVDLMGVYRPDFDINRIPPEQRAQFQRHGMLETFPTGGAIVLHYLTLGIFTTIYMGLKHSKLPHVRADDFRAGKAIGFLFIPFFNVYWVFVFWLRLVDRINFQSRLRNQAPPISRGLMLASVITLIIPYANIISWLVLFPVAISQIQSACNRLAIEATRNGLTRAMGA